MEKITAVSAPHPALFHCEHREQGTKHKLASISMASVLTAAMLAACTPTVRVEAPKDPIVINMNINISHEIRVKVDKDLENLLEKKDDIF